MLLITLEKMTKKITFIIILFCVSLLNAQEIQYSIKNISSNTEHKDFGVNFYGKKKAVLASSQGNALLDLMIGDIQKDGDIINRKEFSNEINTKFHESNAVFTKDLQTVYFTRSNYLNRKITESKKGVILNKLYRAQVGEKGKWVNIKKLPFNRANYQAGHPALNKAEDKLYFTSDMPGSKGLTDIYVVDIYADGSIGNPKNLGEVVNTSKKEMFPYIDENDVLYFSSDGFENNIGGLDIYATKLKKDGTYYKPINLGGTINSPKDDFSFVKLSDSNTGYFASNRDEGKGDDDIYSFIEKKQIDFECNRYAKGQIIDKNTGELSLEAIAILYNENGTELERQIVGENAAYSFKIECNEAYKVIGYSEVYSSNIEEFIVKEDKCIVKLETIYFDLNSSQLRAQSISELDKVVQLMQKYPAIIIESSSHTDSRESDAYNDWISNRRAKRSMDYILSKGIHPNRISAKGYGESRLINSCLNRTYCSEEDHQLNRRTEFEIVNFNEIKNRYPDICSLK